MTHQHVVNVARDEDGVEYMVLTFEDGQSYEFPSFTFFALIRRPEVVEANGARMVEEGDIASQERWDEYTDLQKAAIVADAFQWFYVAQ